MMSFEMFLLGLFTMGCIGGYMSYRLGIAEYDKGFMDAVQLHQEGRLTYSVTDDSGVKTILIEVSDYED